MTKYFLKFLRFFRSISISHSITKTREEKDLTLKLEKDILNLEDIMNSAPSELIQSSLNNKKIEFERKREGVYFFDQRQTGMKMEKNAHNTSVN